MESLKEKIKCVFVDGLYDGKVLYLKIILPNYQIPIISSFESKIENTPIEQSQSKKPRYHEYQFDGLTSGGYVIYQYVGIK